MEFMQYIPIPLLFVVTIGANLGSGIINRHYSKNVSGGIGGFFLFLIITSAVSVIGIAAISGFDLPISTYTAVMGVLFGVVMAVSAVFLLYSIMIGPWSYTTVITSFSTLIPALAGVIFWDQSIDALTITGMVLVGCSIILSVMSDKKPALAARVGNVTVRNECAAACDSSDGVCSVSNEHCAIAGKSETAGAEKKNKTRLSGKWFACVTVAALASGGIGIMQQVHQRSVYRGELMTMLTIAFAAETVILIVALCAFIAKCGRSAVFSRPPATKKSAVLLVFLIVLAGLGGMLNHVINMYLAGIIDSAVFFPLVNGSNLVLVTVLSIFVYRERLSVLQWVGLAVGIAAVLFLCL